ncbi:SMI1/KNR4 family protein [Lysinibacillus sphaericus]|uniref:SMI1/KNR4 family protein n=1 Tax=Lysinibacillus TaxID=400634 RepID=UPI0003A2587F|nr:SMI1/KNR4 family protein [Lysinibacillus sphaericus]
MLQTWVERWETLLKQLEQQGAVVHPLEIQPAANEEELIKVEERIGVRIPSEFRNLLLTGARQVGVYWSLPNEALVPSNLEDMPSGDFGWSLEGLDFPYFGSDDDFSDEHHYLQFYTAGNGDALLIRIEDGSVLYWGHEDGEFDLLAPSFNAYIERVTALGCIGADCGQHRQFCGEDGLDLSRSSSQIWTDWLEQYLTLTLEQAMINLESFLIYVSMHGAEDSKVQEVFANFDSTKVYHAVQSNIVDSSKSIHMQAWSEVLVQVCAAEAADWVRSLWDSQTAVVGAIRDYLTAHCLPADEGLLLVIQDIEENPVNSYIALRRLCHFHNPEIISWMRPYVTFPIDGWEELLVESQPSAEALFAWLNGSEAERQTAIRAVCQMMHRQISPTTRVDKEKWRQLLTAWKENELLRKNKQLFDQALNALNSW